SVESTKPKWGRPLRLEGSKTAAESLRVSSRPRARAPVLLPDSPRVRTVVLSVRIVVFRLLVGVFLRFFVDIIFRFLVDVVFFRLFLRFLGNKEV
ncbi:hypothetical protein, partial [Natronococcus sp.]|uniref:hypothetical protein n=1 Tax=Natronococcus sp. TaxID=35747 RepID=UPI003A4D5EEB